MGYIFRMDEGAGCIIKMLEDAGFEAYAVGGCVRDMMLGRTPQDWDITTNALPEQVKAVFARTFDTGIKHGTVSVRMLGRTYEVTTYRIDGTYRDHRHPDRVSFAGALAEDLSRRDFTINAMAYHPGRGLVDLFKGERDLRKRVVRCVGMPDERFDEDALRMLRALRFSAYLCFDIDEETYEAVKRKRALMAFVSKERIFAELNKTLLSEEPEKMRLVWDSGLMEWCVPAFSGDGFPFETLRNCAPEQVLRWGLFFQRMTPEETENACRDLKMSNDMRMRLIRLSAYRNTLFPENPPEMRRFLAELGKQYFTELIAYRKALGACDEAAMALYEAEKDKPLCIADLAVTGRALIEQGIPAGPGLGEILNELLQIVLKEPEKNTAEYLIKAAEEIVKKQETVV